LAVEVEGVVGAVVEVLEAVLGEGLAEVAAEEGAGVVGVGVVVFSAVLGAASFFSPVVGAAASSPGEGFILSE
jgi:hypothetical protein